MSALQALAPATPSATSAISAPLPSSAASSAALDALYSAALGQGPQTHYLRRFAQFDAAGRTSPGWNGAASFGTLSWAVLRQLWVPALLYGAVLEGLALLAWGAWHWLLPAQAALPWPLLLALAALVWGLPGMYGDALLHTEIRKRIVTALTQTPAVCQRCRGADRHSGVLCLAARWRRVRRPGPKPSDRARSDRGASTGTGTGAKPHGPFRP